MATIPGKSVPDQRSFAAVTISTAASGLSDVVDMTGYSLKAIELSSAAGWTAANLAFLVSYRSSDTLKELWDSSTGAPIALNMTTTGGRFIAITGNQFDGVRFIQLASINTASTAAVAQGAARSAWLILGTPSGPIK